MAYSFAPHVHAADVDGDLVLLDAVRDDYICIGNAERRRPATPSLSPHNLPDEWVEALAGEGLLVCTESSRALRPLARTASSDLLPHQRAALRARDIIYLLVAAARTRRWLHRFSPADWFERLRSCPLDLASDPVATRDAARRFRQLRPWLPRSGRCLVQSLLLLHFLRLQNLPATWVFGVRTFPFEAHCWLECEGIVLDDTAEHVDWFTPIVRVP